MSHTPGPWSYEELDREAGSDGLLIGGPDLALAEVMCDRASCACENNPPCERTRANGRLIAAAPDLLQVALFWHRHMGREHDCGGPDDCLHCLTEQAIEKAGAAATSSPASNPQGVSE